MAVQASSLATALHSIREGHPVLVRHEDKTMLVAAAATANAELIRLYERATAAPPAVALDAPLFDRLGLHLPAGSGSGFPHGVTVDADPADAFAAMSRSGRAGTIRALARPDTSSFTSPGHVTPLRSSPGNLLTRIGLVEAAVDLIGLTGMTPAAVVSFMVNESGEFQDPALWPETTGATAPVEVRLDDVRTARLHAEGGMGDGEVSQLFLDSMTQLAAAVSVITCFSSEGLPVGLVVSSMASYSSIPPSVVISVAQSGRSHAALAHSDTFGVNVLAKGQEALARNFASRAEDKYAGVRWESDHGVPRLPGVQAFLRCRKIGEFALGDHTLMVGSILSGETAPLDPLIYYNRRFTWELNALEEAG